MDTNTSGSVIRVAVVGAGMSGLAAAASLAQKGFDVVLLEASDYIGGRVKQVEPFPGFPPVDLGGGFIHGSNTIINKIAKENGWKVKKADDATRREDDTMVFLNGKLYPLLGNQSEIASAVTALDKLINTGDQQSSNETCREREPSDKESDFLVVRLREQNLSDVAIQVVNVLDIQARGGTLSYYGVEERREKARGMKDWGSKNFRLEGSYSLLVSSYLKKCQKVDKRLNWLVKDIHWKENQAVDSKKQSVNRVHLTNQYNETIEANYAVITVPLRILKDGDIVFSPPLPTEKRLAIDRIGMGAALKIVCRFRRRFWRETRFVCAPHGFLSQIWMFSRDPRENGEECHVLVGVQTADLAAQKVHLTDEVVCGKFLEQLDQMFGTTEDPRPASRNFINFVYYHWSKHPYVRGGYSTPTAHAYGSRQHLASPVGGCLFFAGEATNVKVSATVHSAIETGMRAAEEVCQTARQFRGRQQLRSKI